MMVDENRIKGSAKKLSGKLQDAVGDLAGDAGIQARGKANQAASTAQNAFGSAMDLANELEWRRCRDDQGQAINSALGCHLGWVPCSAC